jgi:hypothetical protein
MHGQQDIKNLLASFKGVGINLEFVTLDLNMTGKQ